MKRVANYGENDKGLLWFERQSKFFITFSHYYHYFKVDLFADELKSLNEEIDSSYCDIRNQEAKWKVLSALLNIDIEQVSLSLQIELIGLSSNSI